MRPSRIGVVLPAHDEESLIAAALRALAVAAERVAVPVHVVVVLDTCRDRTAEFVAGADASGLVSLESTVVDATRVGEARRAGVERLLHALPVAGTWLATTDADSTVPAGWFERQLAHAAGGAAAIAGTVAVSDWSGLPATVERAYRERYLAMDGHRHVHGANLSFTAGAYRAVGGFRPSETDEDVELVDAFIAGGFRVLWAADLAVTTSARLRARAMRGFADHLAALA